MTRARDPLAPAPQEPTGELPAAWLLGAVPDGLWMLDDEGRTTYANDQMAHLLGVDPADVLGYSAYDALDEQGRTDLRQHLAKRRSATEPGPDLVCRLERLDGEVSWGLVSHTPVRDDEGRLRGWLYRVQDHTGEQSALEELWISQAKMAETQAIARIGSWEYVFASERLIWSEETYRLSGVRPEEFEPTPERALALFHDDDQPRVATAYLEMLDGTDLDVVAMLKSVDGQRTWLRMRGGVVTEESGTPQRIGGTVQDVTAFREHAQGLEFLTSMAAAANESPTLGDLLMTFGTQVRPYSQWDCLVVAAPASHADDTLALVDLVEHRVPADVRRFAAELTHTAAAARTVLFERGPHGRVVVSGPVVRHGRVVCVVTSDTGATGEPSASDRTIFDQLLVLIGHVAERERASRDLAHARDEALAASRAKSEFVATMSHEIRTPLNGVIGLSELLRRTDLNSHQERLAAGIDQAGRTLLALVNDILDLSKIEAGALELEQVDFDPLLVLEQSARLLADQAHEKGVELVVSGAPGLPTLVRGDPVRFGQVVTNLVSNAVKFTSVGEVVVRAEAGSAPGEVQVQVHDTGVGIAPEARERLFEAFTQADSSTTREYGGTGLGLAISSRIVAAMSGELGAESEPGVGSTFWFRVAFAPALAAGRPRSHLGESAVHGLRVLVVDDNETNRYILTEQLTDWGVRVRSVPGARAALTQLDEAEQDGAPYDVVLIDALLPGIDGEGLAREVRAEGRHARTRLVLVSSALEATPEWLEDAGFDGYLVKPVLPSSMLAVLAEVNGPVRRAVGADGPTARPGAGRVLVVEDNTINQLVADGMLRRLGFDVVFADNGAEALTLLAPDPRGFDAILMDCQMPVMDGFDTTRAVRAMQGHGPRTPIIAMTAAAVAEERERCLAAGMDDFMTKPIDSAHLEEVLSRWVAPPTSPEPAASAPDTGARERLSRMLDQDGLPGELLAPIVAGFKSTALDSLQAIAAATAAGSAPELVRHLHGLRGAAANLGLGEVADLCAAAEEDAKGGELPDHGRLAALRTAVAAANRELAAFLGSRPRPT